MNKKKTIKFLLECDGLLAATKVLTLAMPSSFLGVLMPPYFASMLVLGLVSGGYYQAKAIYTKKKEEAKSGNIKEEDLFKLED